MRGLTREQRHQWHGQPGDWTCKRCFARITGALHSRRNLDDGICSASLSGRLDYTGAVKKRSGFGLVCGGCGSGRRWKYLAPPYTTAQCQCGFDGPTVRVSPTRLDTPETVDRSARQGGLGELLRSTGKGRQVSPEQGDKR